MDLLQLQYFCTIAQYENITRAAKALFVSQPNLSTSLSRLEDDLGVKLFERRRGKVSLTPNGQLFLSYAERVLSELNAGIDAVKAAQRASRDQLRVVGSQMDFVFEVLRSYYPTDSSMTLRQVNCANLDVYDRVLSDDADFGFYYGKPKTKILEYAPAKAFCPSNTGGNGGLSDVLPDCLPEKEPNSHPVPWPRKSPPYPLRRLRRNSSNSPAEQRHCPRTLQNFFPQGGAFGSPPATCTAVP